MSHDFLSRRRLLTTLAAAGLMAAPWRAGAGQPTLSLDPSHRDGALVDRRWTAPLLLSGRAPAGAVIEARLAGAPGLSIWRSVATAGLDGRWSARLSPPASATGWLRPEVRNAAAPEVVLVAGQVGLGHVVAIWGQSELHRAVLPAHAALTSAPRVRDPEALQVTYSTSARDDYGDPSRLEHVRVSDKSPVSAHIAALSNLLSEAAPGERFHLIFHTRAGTGFQQLLDDANSGRNWADDLALHRFALPEGQRPGLGWVDWYNSDAALAERYGSVLFTALMGRGPDGTAVTPGSVPPLGRAPMDHSFAELYGADMPWAIAGPHRFELHQFDGPIAAARASVDRLFENPNLPPNISRALEPLTYLNGNPAWNGDFSHPDTLDQPQDGMTRLMLLMGNSILRQLGLLSFDLPAFDQARLTENGHVLEVWSSAGPVTTTRLARGETRPQGTPEVAGFTIDYAPARDASLTQGRVRIRSATPFAPGTRIAFGGGGIGSEDVERDTRQRQVWRDYPIVDVGQVGLEGIPVKAQTPRAVLDVIPAAARPTDTAPGPNLWPKEITDFVARPKGPGWVKTSLGWHFAPRTRTVTADAQAGGVIRAATGNAALGPLAGENLRLHFVAQGEGSDPEVLRVIVTATGGGATPLFAEDITLGLGRPTLLDLPPFPTDRRGLSLTFRRRGWPTGSLTIGALALIRA